MLILTRALILGSRAAFLTTAALLVASAITHALKGLDLEASLTSALLLIALLGARRAFTRRHPPPSPWPRALTTTLAAIALILTLGIALLPTPDPNSTQSTLIQTLPHAARPIRAAALLLTLPLTFTIAHALTTTRSRRTPNP